MKKIIIMCFLLSFASFAQEKSVKEDYVGGLHLKKITRDLNWTDLVNGIKAENAQSFGHNFYQSKLDLGKANSLFGEMLDSDLRESFRDIKIKDFKEGLTCIGSLYIDSSLEEEKQTSLSTVLTISSQAQFSGTTYGSENVISEAEGKECMLRVMKEIAKKIGSKLITYQVILDAEAQDLYSENDGNRENKDVLSIIDNAKKEIKATQK